MVSPAAMRSTTSLGSGRIFGRRELLLLLADDIVIDIILSATVTLYSALSPPPSLFHVIAC
jgi:hypothetical protein